MATVYLNLKGDTMLSMFFKKFVLTGGPCGGKTTILQLLRDRLQDAGFRVIIVPEAATIVIPNFPDIAEIIAHHPAQHREIQRAIIDVNCSLEYALTTLSSPQERTIVIFDRHNTDARVYAGDTVYLEILSEKGLHPDNERDRFDGILHLVTAADGAEAYYGNENNAARYESAEKARERDKELQRAWTGTPHLAIIDNSTGFQEKQERAWKWLCHWIGLPIPVEYERKFLLKRPPTPELLASHTVASPIEQLYLRESSGEDRIRRRGSGLGASYYRTRKTQRADGGRDEYEEAINTTEYLDLMREQDPTTRPIRKIRHCFVHDNQYCELDQFLGRHEGLWMLEIEGTEANHVCSPPSWLDIEREVTHDSTFSNYALSLA